MRFIIIICSALLLFSSVFAQDKVDGQDQYTESIRLVKRDIESRELGFSLSVIGKRIPRLGDGVSIALLKIYKGDALEIPENIRNYLPTVRAAFTAPKLNEHFTIDFLVGRSLAAKSFGNQPLVQVEITAEVAWILKEEKEPD